LSADEPFHTEIVIQVIIVFVGGVAFNVQSISGEFWGISIALGTVSLPLGFLVRLIPNGPIEKMAIALHILPDPNALPTVDPGVEKYPSAIETVRDDLSMFANIRGGRIRASSVALKSRTKRMKEANIRLPTLMTMVPALVASSVGARWAATPSLLHDPANGDPSRSSAALWEGKLQLHPDTKSDHPAYAKWGAQVERRPSMSPGSQERPVKK
jgi:P-type Ca2+ transporter type 2C